MIHTSTISRFAGDGWVWRSFDHLLAAGPGRLLLVPVGLADGDMTGVVDGCPVPWPEVWALLDAPPAEPAPVTERALARLWPDLALQLTPFGWERDVVPAGATVPTMTRLVGPDGVRAALLGDGEG